MSYILQMLKFQSVNLFFCDVFGHLDNGSMHGKPDKSNSAVGIALRFTDIEQQCQSLVLIL